MKHAIRLVSVLSLCLALFGCSQNLSQLRNSNSIADLVAALSTITVADLDAATARAIAGGDQMGAACYPVLKKYVQQGLPGAQKFAGAIDAFEAARLGRKNFSAGVPDDLRMGCAALLMDERDFALRLAAIGAAGAATGGAAPLIVGPAIPAAALLHP